MYNYDVLEMVFLFLKIYGFLILILLASYVVRFFREYANNRKLIFTRDALRQVQNDIENEKIDIFEATSPWNAIRIMSLYNEVAVGINEGLYDEAYTRLIMGHDMKLAYKKYYIDAIKMCGDDPENPVSRYLPLELLLKKWDEQKVPSYRVKKRRFF